MGLGDELHNPSLSSSTPALDSSNVGFQLLKKHGWKEGTGLGASQQGRLEPVEAYLKKNKRGLGAEKTNKKTLQSTTKTISAAEKSVSLCCIFYTSQSMMGLCKNLRVDSDCFHNGDGFYCSFFEETLIKISILLSYLICLRRRKRKRKKHSQKE
ncbi:unnamed protein product [Amaranthus hypochondriacus]